MFPGVKGSAINSTSVSTFNCICTAGCSDDKRCQTSIACYSSLVRVSDETAVIKKGCISDKDHYQLTCWGTPNKSSRQHDTVCCNKNECNAQINPTFPPSKFYPCITDYDTLTRPFKVCILLKGLNYFSF